MEVGKKVKFIEEDVSDIQIQWGGHNNPVGLLKVGQEYEIEDIEVRGWNTKIFLKGFEGSFNSVWFKGL